MKHLFGILILIAGFVIAPSASAGDLIISRAVLEDVTGALTNSDVQGAGSTCFCWRFPLADRRIMDLPQAQAKV